MKILSFDGKLKFSIKALFALAFTIITQCANETPTQLIETDQTIIVDLPLNPEMEVLPIIEYTYIEDTITIYLLDADNSSIIKMIVTAETKKEIRLYLESNSEFYLSSKDHATILNQKLIVFSYRFQLEIHYDLETGKILNAFKLQELLDTPGRLFLNPFEIKHPTYNGSLIYQIGHDHPRIVNKATQASFNELPRRCLLDSVQNNLISFGSAPLHSRKGISYEDGLEFSTMGNDNRIWISQQNSDSIEEYLGPKLVRKHLLSGTKWIDNKPFDLSREMDKKYKWDYLTNRSTYLWLYADKNKRLLYRIMQISSTREFFLIVYDYTNMQVIQEKKLDYDGFDFRVFLCTRDGFYVREVSESIHQLKLRYFTWSKI